MDLREIWKVSLRCPRRPELPPKIEWKDALRRVVRCGLLESVGAILALFLVADLKADPVRLDYEKSSQSGLLTTKAFRCMESM